MYLLTRPGIIGGTIINPAVVVWKHLFCADIVAFLGVWKQNTQML
jgi:hypothetical protein